MSLSLLPSTFQVAPSKKRKARKRHYNGNDLVSEQQWRMLCALIREEHGLDPWDSADTLLEDEYGVDECTLTVAEFVRIKRELEGYESE